MKYSILFLVCLLAACSPCPTPEDREATREQAKIIAEEYANELFDVHDARAICRHHVGYTWYCDVQVGGELYLIRHNFQYPQTRLVVE